MAVIVEKRGEDRKWLKVGQHDRRADALASLPNGILRHIGETTELDVMDGDEYRIRPVPRKRNRRMMDAVMASVGMVRVKGALGGTYWE